MNGHTSFKNSLMGHLVMPQVVNIMEPNGGVIPPIMMLTIMTRPKWMVSTPSFCATGRSSGVVIIRAAPPSRKSAVDKAADDEAVDNSNRAALGGSEHTEAHTDDDTEREEQTPEGDERLLEYLGELRELVSGGGVIALLCDDRNDDHHGQGHQDAGDIACGKDLAQRNLREKAVDDEVDSGRNDGGRSRRGGGDGRGERLGVTTSLHLRNEHLGLHCAVGVCGTGAAAHQHGQQHVDLCKAAAHMTGNTLTEVH